MTNRPRGFYKDTSYLKWSKDETIEYFGTPMLRYGWPLIKILVLVATYYWCKLYVGCWHLGVTLCVVMLLSYQYVIALIFPNTIVMPVMDQQTLISEKSAIVNYMNASTYHKYSEEVFWLQFEELFKLIPKFRYKIKEIAGDYYYEEMTLEECKKKVFLTPQSNDKILKNQQDIDEYIRDNLNVKMPLDGPLLRVYV